jgi:hypothetical protein
VTSFDILDDYLAVAQGNSRNDLGAITIYNLEDFTQLDRVLGTSENSGIG